jgi:pimeloyl-ACP methyl ester carboxylesterase
MIPDGGEIRSQKIALPNGIHLNVTCWPRSLDKSPDVPVLLIHGLGDSASVWRDVARRIPPPRSIFAVDLRGHGNSDWDAAGAYDARVLAEDIHALIQVLALPKVSVVGHSLGGNVALNLASAHPSQIDRIALADFTPELDPGVLTHVIRELRGSHRPYDSIAEYIKVLVERYPLAEPDILRWIAEETTCTSREGTKIQIAPKYDPAVLTSVEKSTNKAYALLQRPHAWDSLKRLQCPVLVLRGSGSSVLSAAVAQRIVQSVTPGASLHVIPVSGHSIQIDNPAAVADALIGFIDGSASVHGGRQNRENGYQYA